MRASRAGLVTVLWSVGSTVAGFASSRLLRRVGARALLVVSSVAAIVAYVLIVLFHTNVGILTLELGLFGFGMGLFTTVIPIILVHEVSDSETGVTTGMNQNVRTLGGAVGTQTVATILASGLRADGFPRETMYTVSFIFLTGACIAMLFAALSLPRRLGRVAR